MPPTVADIKARLDRAVDREGNVLDMDAVHEIVNWLESVSITQEALQATRLGLIMNLMRKKTQNEDLAKRVKKLIKKWKEAVTKQYPKKLLNGDIGNGSVESPNLKTNNKSRDENKAGIKRKRKNDLGSPSGRVSSPSISSNKLSPKLNPGSPYGNRLIQKGPKPVSPLVNSKTPNNIPLSRGSPHSPLINVNDTRISVTKKQKNDTNNELVQDKIPLKTNDVHHCTNNGNINKPNCTNNLKIEKTEDFNDVKSEDTRVQENRISSYDSGYHGALSSEENTPNSLDFSDKVFKPVRKSPPHVPKPSAPDPKPSTPPDPKSFEDIDEEDLAQPRKELPEEMISPEVPADGVNGVYNENDNFCNWTEEIVLHEKDYHILPYVILD